MGRPGEGEPGRIGQKHDRRPRPRAEPRGHIARPVGQDVPPPQSGHQQHKDSDRRHHHGDHQQFGAQKKLQDQKGGQRQAHPDRLSLLADQQFVEGPNQQRRDHCHAQHEVGVGEFHQNKR